MILLHEDQVFVLEFKRVEDGTGTEEGLDSTIMQIQERGYAGKYRNRGADPLDRNGVWQKREKPAGNSCRDTLTACQGD